MISKLKRYGLMGMLQRSVWAILSLIKIKYSSHLLYKKEIELTSKYDNLTYKSLNFIDFENQQKLNPQWFDTDKISSIKQAFSIKGTSAFGLFEGKLLISYGFLSTSFLGLNDEIHLIKDDCYLWDAYTHPCARGRRLHKLLTIYIEREAYRIGKKRALVIVASFNKASCKTYERLGYCIMQKYYTVRFWKNREKTNFKYGKQQ